MQVFFTTFFENLQKILIVLKIRVYLFITPSIILPKSVSIISFCRHRKHKLLFFFIYICYPDYPLSYVLYKEPLPCNILFIL